MKFKLAPFIFTSKSPSSGRDPWGKDRRNCNAERGRTKWQPILRHGDAADSGSSLDGHRQVSEANSTCPPLQALPVSNLKRQAERTRA